MPPPHFTPYLQVWQIASGAWSLRRTTTTGVAVALAGLVLAHAVSGVPLNALHEYGGWLNLAVITMAVSVFWCATWAWGAVAAAIRRVQQGMPLSWALAAMAGNQLAALLLCLHTGSVLQYPLHVWHLHRADALPVAALDWLPPSPSAPSGRLLLRGPVGKGSALRLQAWLARYPHARQVELAFGQALLPEVQAMAMLIQARGLDTVVQGRCEGLCPWLALSGARRWVGPDAGIRLYRVYVPVWSFARVQTPADRAWAQAVQPLALPDSWLPQLMAARPWQPWPVSADEWLRWGLATDAW